MDKTTAGGIAGVWGLVALAIVLGGAGFGAYVDVPSVIIVLGGTASVTIAQYESDSMAKFGKVVGIAMSPVSFEPVDELIEKIIIYATDIKKNGVMTVETKIQDEENPFFKEAFNLLVDNTKPDVLENLLEIKLEHIENRHRTMIAIFSSIGGTAGSMGMIGTLVGLVAMLANLSDPSAVGPAMAVALLTTMYGALIGTGFAGVFESKLTQKHNKEMINCQIIIQGAHMIASEEAIGNVKMKLGAIMPATED
ncbi:MAG: MotA/TolQ/ExbB proton channel family protein [Arcobacteraceae bacterium]